MLIGKYTGRDENGRPTFKNYMEGEKMKKTIVHVCINTWDNYSENGTEGAEWLALPMDPDELEKELDRIADAMGDTDPRFFINDFMWMTDRVIYDLEKNNRIKEVNVGIARFSDLDEYEQDIIEAILEATGGTFEYTLNIFDQGAYEFYENATLAEVAEIIADDCFFTDDTPDAIVQYFNYEAFGRNLRYKGYTETLFGVIYIKQ